MPKKILVVDDEKSLLELVEAVLTTEGFEVITAESGERCLQLLEKEKPDLILMDHMMPGMTGIETARKIRTNPLTKNIKIVFLTILTIVDIGDKEFNSLNIQGYIRKPFENRMLVQRIKKVTE